MVARDAEVQTVRVVEDLFVCDETDGLPTMDQEGGVLSRLGTGDRRVVGEIRNRLSERAENQIASINCILGKS